MSRVTAVLSTPLTFVLRPKVCELFSELNSFLDFVCYPEADTIFMLSHVPARSSAFKNAWGRLLVQMLASSSAFLTALRCLSTPCFQSNAN